MTQQEAIDKALKLLRLAKSSNEHEAALAASKAQEVMDKYKLDISSLEYDKQDAERDSEQVKDFGYGDPLIEFSHLSDNRWLLSLATTVARSNQCRIIYSKIDGVTGNLGKEIKRGATIKIVGHPSDVQVVRYLYSYLRNEVERLIKENCVGNSISYKRGFGLGVVDTIANKLWEQKKQTESAMRGEYAHNPLALVRVNNAIAKVEKRSMAVDKYIEQNMNLGKGRGGYANKTEGMNARAHGRVAGENVRFTLARGALGTGRKQIEN